MKIIDSEWTPQVNFLKIHCDCTGVTWRHRADRWRVVCPQCDASAHLSKLREQYVAEWASLHSAAHPD